MRIRFLALAAAFSALLLAGCSRREASAPEAPPGAPPPESAAIAQPAAPATGASPASTGEATPATEPAAPATTAAAPSAPPKSARRIPVSPSSSKPEPAPQPAASEPRPAAAAQSAPTRASAPPEASAPKVDDPGGVVAMASTRPGATRIGAEKCKLCHKLQYASWAEHAHAKRTPPLDCENCHGPGSEYKTLSVMKDPAKAKDAGLVIPDASFCATCHKRNWKSDMLEKTHAHKAKSAP